MECMEYIDDDDMGYQFPVAYYGIDEDFEHDGQVKWSIISPTGVKTERISPAVLWSPLDYGIWTVVLYVQDEDSLEWERVAVHEFDNQDPDNPPDAVMVPADNDSVN